MTKQELIELIEHQPFSMCWKPFVIFLFWETVEAVVFVVLFCLMTALFFSLIYWSVSFFSSFPSFIVVTVNAGAETRAALSVSNSQAIC